MSTQSCGCFRASSSGQLFIPGTHINHCILSTVLSVRGACSLIAIGFIRRVSQSFDTMHEENLWFIRRARVSFAISRLGT